MCPLTGGSWGHQEGTRAGEGLWLVSVTHWHILPPSQVGSLFPARFGLGSSEFSLGNQLWALESP